jgi:hypothetical protein
MFTSKRTLCIISNHLGRVVVTIAITMHLLEIIDIVSQLREVWKHTHILNALES